ncbi:Nn.00g052320.m01.CDS01 [Neocucurbitaria sp. VM-36]
MPPPRALTGDTFTDEKPPQSPVSPTNTDATLMGDAVEEATRSSLRPSQRTNSSIDLENGSQPPENKKKRPKLLHRITHTFKSEPEPEDVLENRTRKLENTPNGFPRLAAFQSSEANFSLYRSFSYLHSRVLLDLQDEITSLEKELDEMDWDDFDEEPDRLRSREIDVDRSDGENDTRNRRVILREIREKLMEYDEVLIKARTLESFQKPSDRNYRSLRRYHHNQKPLMDAEMDSVRSKEDIVSLHNGREWATFDGGVETMIGQVDRLLQKVFRTRTPPLQKYFRTPELQEKTSNEYIAFYSSTRIDKLVNILITFVIFILLVIPVVTMYHLTNTAAHVESEPTSSNSTSTSKSSSSGMIGSVDTNNRDTFNAVGVLVVFTLLFSSAMSLLTKAARHELFAGQGTEEISNGNDNDTDDAQTPGQVRATGNYSSPSHPIFYRVGRNCTPAHYLTCHTFTVPDEKRPSDTELYAPDIPTSTTTLYRININHNYTMSVSVWYYSAIAMFYRFAGALIGFFKTYPTSLKVRTETKPSDTLDQTLKALVASFEDVRKSNDKIKDAIDELTIVVAVMLKPKPKPRRAGRVSWRVS